LKYNKFKIICPSHNNEAWVETHIESILEQTYDNYEVLYIDDSSTDDTWKLVNDLVGNHSKFKLIRNDINKGATYNYIEYLDDFMSSDEEILVHLDGDDWFGTADALEKLNDLYNKNDYWMTYGGFIVWDGSENIKQPFPQNTEYDNLIHSNSSYRGDLWRASHLRTYKWFLFRAIDRKDFISNIDNKYFWHAGDLAFAYPCLEMCPSDKIGVVDFVTMVYNASAENQTRTRDRESVDNYKFEEEIRSKKKYRRITSKEKLTGEKLPQVNVFYGYMELHTNATKFSYCYDRLYGDFDLVYLGDEQILDYIEGKINIDKKVPVVIRLLEQRDYFQRRIFNAVLDNADRFDLILTYDKILLEKLPNTKFMPANDVCQFNIQPNPSTHPNHKPYKASFMDSYKLPENDIFKLHHKNKLVSCVTSNKSFLPGHSTRLEFIDRIKDKVDLFGRGINPIDSKLDALINYAFSIGIENKAAVDDYYWTEKLNDCLLTGTVPIYYGCPNISKFFNMDGILTFTTQEELDDILNNLSFERYESMMPAIKDNLKRAKKYPLNNNDMYDNFFKELI